MDYILRDIDIELWSKVKAKATLERKSMREVLFEGLKWYVTASEIPAKAGKKNKKIKRQLNLILIYPIKYNGLENPGHLLSHVVWTGTFENTSGLPFRDRAAAADVLDAIREHGLHPPGVRFKQIRGKLWEFYIEAGASHRVFYVAVTGAICVFFPQTPPK